jgi:hypothetical protein
MREIVAVILALVAIALPIVAAYMMNRMKAKEKQIAFEQQRLDKVVETAVLLMENKQLDTDDLQELVAQRLAQRDSILVGNGDKESFEKEATEDVPPSERKPLRRVIKKRGKKDDV